MATRILNVQRKPRKCPKCGESVWDIIYGTGDMTEPQFLLEYRKSAIMGGDVIPRNPALWECACGCCRFRKVNPDGSVAKVKVKMLDDVRKAPMTLINWESSLLCDALMANEHVQIHHYLVKIVTEYNEEETFNVTALDKDDAIETVRDIVSNKGVLFGTACVEVQAIEVLDWGNSKYSLLK